ncbi:ABC transporter G family member 3-like [Frieseomelitta varia]|uniref:ABC transporter G family member 3-like n=1 Tax=Frieseomelitta varia TaxID=561572 RepID=UPI001CB6AC05|nr:ABC transporter G family member 3-like [Frieseomelitta varia]
MTATEETEPLISSRSVASGGDKTQTISYNTISLEGRSDERTGVSCRAGSEEDASSFKLKSILHGSYAVVAPPATLTIPPRSTENESITYTWSDLNVYADRMNEKPWEMFSKRRKPTERRHLLKDVCGVAYPGELLVIMGSSGAGKTTLLNALTFRSGRGVTASGVMAANGRRVSSTILTSRTAYVQQDDLFVGTLTVKEHLLFQAMVRMDRRIPMEQRFDRVHQVINELALSKCRNTVIGQPGRIKGLSGGEMKRLSFASEVLTDPPLMFCDEPTSGLDSFMAHQVVSVLKTLAARGKTIVATLHQPSSELFALFDRILLMAEGRVAFMGTTSQACSFFETLGAACPSNYNPADYFVQMLAVVPGEEISCRHAINTVCDAFQKSEHGIKIALEAEAINGEFEDSLRDSKYSKNRSLYKASWCEQFRAVLWRSWLSVIKEPILIKVRLLQTVMVSLLVGIVYFNQRLDQDGVMNINGALFIFLTNMTFQNVFAVINVFCTELPIFLREHRNGMYRTDVYFLCKTLAEAPIFIAVPLLFTVIAYPMIGLYPGIDHFFITAGIVALVANVSTSFGYLISCVSSNLSMALSIGPPVIIPFLLFGGFFLNTASVPVYFEWFSYLSWFRYGNEALLINQWSEVESIECTRSNATCPKSGRMVLQTFNFKQEHFWTDIVCLFSLIIAFRFLAFLALLSKTWTNAKQRIDFYARSVAMSVLKDEQPAEEGAVRLGDVTLSWRNLSVYAMDRGRRNICKQLINNVKGAAKPGDLTAIIGASGAGKSSLMAALAFRAGSEFLIHGDIRVNGMPVDSSYMMQNSGYMHQEDIFVAAMTVVEHLWFMARMKLNGNMRVLDIGRKIDDLLKDVGLTSRRDVRIGSGIDDKVLSGGERKRLSFATELLTDPKILFLDEPTTGQDSHSANCLIAQLKSFAAKGRTVLCTIHQPSSVIFSSFDRIILIAEGRVAFAGRIDQAVEFFASQGYECPRKYNPADFLVAIVATGSKNENGEEVAHNICDVFSTSKISNEIDRILEKQIESHRSKLLFDAKLITTKEARYCSRLYWLIYRDFLQVSRDPSIQIIRILQKVSVAAIAGLCFVGAVNFDQLGIQATQGVLFILVSENAFFPMYATLALIPQELPLLRREYRAGMYPVHLYYTARILSLIPGLIIEPILFATIVYWLAGLRDDAETFGLTLLVLLLTINVSTACGCFFSTAFESVPLAMAYLIPFDYILMITMGPFLKLGSLPVYVRWVKYISWLLHSSEALSILQWNGVHNISCETTDSELPCITEGIDVLHRYDFDETNFWIDMLSMVVIYFIFHILACVCLWNRCRSK